MYAHFFRCTEKFEKIETTTSGDARAYVTGPERQETNIPGRIVRHVPVVHSVDFVVATSRERERFRVHAHPRCHRPERRERHSTSTMTEDRTTVKAREERSKLRERLSRSLARDTLRARETHRCATAGGCVVVVTSIDVVISRVPPGDPSFDRRSLGARRCVSDQAMLTGG